MKNELSRNNAYNDYDFFDEAVRSFFPTCTAAPKRTSICAPTSRSATMTI